MTDREKLVMSIRLTPKEYDAVKKECGKQNISIQRFIKNLLGTYFAGKSAPAREKNGAKNNPAPTEE